MNRYFGIVLATIGVLLTAGVLHADDAALLPNGIQYFMDNNGRPLANGKVYFYTPSTTTAKTTWTSASKATAQANPVQLGVSGRPTNPIYGEGSYRQIVKDSNNNTIWDFNTASTGSGGGSSPTATGDGDLVGTIKPWAGITAPSQYAFTYGQAISRTTYAALFTAITSAQSVFCTSGSPVLAGLSDTNSFWIGMSVELGCLASGNSTVISKTSTTVTLAANANLSTNVTATFFPWGRGDGTTTFNLPDFRGVVPAGNNIMGGTSSANLTTTYFGSQDPNSAGALGGSQSITLVAGNLPSHTHTSSTLTDPGHTHAFNGPVNTAQGSGSGTVYSLAQTVTTTSSATTGITLSASTGTNSSGLSTPFSRVQPTRTTNYIIKITPDSNSATASGVTSLGGMTGDIACGTGLLCTGNTISSTAGSTANPTASVGLTAVNGVASTTMRSDAAPALSQAIVPTWTGLHTFAPSSGRAIDAYSPSAINSTAETPTVVKILDGNTSGQAVTASASPTVLVSRIEAITAGLSDGADGPAIHGVTTTTTGATQQGVGVTGEGFAASGSTADIVGVYGKATQSGSGGANTAFGGFFQGKATTAGSGAIGVQLHGSNNTSTNFTYNPATILGGTPFMVALDVVYDTTTASTGQANILIRNGAAAADVGIAFYNGAGAADIQTNTTKDNIILAGATSRVDGIDLAAATFSGNAFASPGFSVGGTGNVSIASGKNITLDAGTGKIDFTNASEIYRNNSTGSLTLSSQTGLVVGPAWNGTTSSANAIAVGRQGTTSPAFHVDASTASSATGLKVTAAAAGDGVAVAAISSGTNESLAVDAKGSGSITLGGTSTGGITLTRAVTASSTLAVSGTSTLTGKVAIGTTTNDATLKLVNNVATGFLDNFSEYQILLNTQATAADSYGWALRAGFMVFNAGGGGGYAWDIQGTSTPMTLTNAGQLSISTTTASTSPTTGSAIFAGGVGVTGAIWAGTYVATGVVAVASLPACGAGIKGARMFVNNATATTFASIVAAGGANNVPVVCDGTNWIIG